MVRRVKARDQGSWRRLVRIYGPLIYRWARESGLQAADAEDIVGGVFADVFSGIERFQFDGSPHSFRRWLRIVCLRKIQKHYRKLRSLPEAFGGSTANVRINSAEVEDLPEDEVARNDEIIWLRQRAMKIVQDDYAPIHWQVFRRSVLDGEAPADVARAMGMTVWAVYKVRSRILHRLRIELSELA